MKKSTESATLKTTEPQPAKATEKVTITTFYKFFTMTEEQVQSFKKDLESFSENIRGLIITGHEGVNGTVCGDQTSIDEFKAWLENFINPQVDSKLLFKNSYADYYPFRLLKVKIRPEIVSLGNTEILPESETDATHLSPEEWDEMLASDDSICIDTRNWYETEMGMFRGAIDPNLNEFHEFPDYLESNNIPKDKKIMMYCTGGIRCEKAIIDAKKRGFKEVYQLGGGILNYLEKKPNGTFEGECFVFDNRVAVQPNLEPSETYNLCPHCGQPAKDDIQCLRCDSDAKVCKRCLTKAGHLETCSKNCSYQYQLHPGKKGKKQDQGFRASLKSYK